MGGLCHAWTTRSAIIRENHPRSEETVVSNRHATPQHRLILDRHSVADKNAAFDEGPVADIAIPAQNGAWHNVCKGPDAAAIADLIRFT
jgi:hypothetical protein